MKQMNKNKLTRISILIASLWVSSYQNLGAQGLKLQGLTAPPGGGGLSGSASSAPGSANAGKSGLRPVAQPSSVRGEDAAAEGSTGPGSLLQ